MSETLAELAERLLEARRTARISGLRGAAGAVLAAELVRAAEGRPLLVLTPTAKAADVALHALREALGERGAPGRVRAFPRYDTRPYERFSPQPFVVAQRMEALYRWLASPKGAQRAEGERSRTGPDPRARSEPKASEVGPDRTRRARSEPKASGVPRPSGP